jgi:hypothetical protein
VLGFDGDEFRNATEVEVEIITRYETVLEVQAIGEVVFGESVDVTVKLMGGLGNINGAEIELQVDLDGINQMTENTTTQSLGTVRVSLVGLGAGNHTIKVFYYGDDVFAPATTSVQVLIFPQVSVAMSVVNAFVGANTTLTISLDIGGVESNWTGMLDLIIFDPEGKQTTSLNQEIDGSAEVTLSLKLELEGKFLVNVTISSLPLSRTDARQLSFDATIPPPVIQMDGSTISLTSGIVFVALIGFVILKRFNKVLSSLPSEWSN